MKIVTQIKQSQRFADTVYGTVFYHGLHLYMRIEPFGDGYINGVRLDTGKPSHFADDNSITIVEGAFILG